MTPEGIRKLRAEAAAKIGIENFDGSAYAYSKLPAEQQIELTDVMCHMIIEDPESWKYSEQQMQTARKRLKLDKKDDGMFLLFWTVVIILLIGGLLKGCS